MIKQGQGLAIKNIGHLTCKDVLDFCGAPNLKSLLLCPGHSHKIYIQMHREDKSTNLNSDISVAKIYLN